MAVQDPGIIFLDGYPYIWITFIVCEHGIVMRSVFLYKVALQYESFEL